MFAEKCPDIGWEDLEHTAAEAEQLAERLIPRSGASPSAIVSFFEAWKECRQAISDARRAAHPGPHPGLGLAAELSQPGRYLAMARARLEAARYLLTRILTEAEESRRLH